MKSEVIQREFDEHSKFMQVKYVLHMFSFCYMDIYCLHWYFISTLFTLKLEEKPRPIQKENIFFFFLKLPIFFIAATQIYILQVIKNWKIYILRNTFMSNGNIHNGIEVYYWSITIIINAILFLAILHHSSFKLLNKVVSASKRYLYCET